MRAAETSTSAGDEYDATGEWLGMVVQGFILSHRPIFAKACIRTNGQFKASGRPMSREHATSGRMDSSAAANYP
jgi:hypothetical protein